MAEQRVIRKSLAGEEDILLGKGKVTQTRNAVDYEISRINVAKLFDTVAEMVADTSLTVNQTVEVGLSQYRVVPAGTEVDYTDLVTHQAQLVRQVSSVFNTVADLTASMSLTVGQKVRTLGYHTIGDGGGNEYNIVAAATATADGGSYTDLAAHQAKGLFVSASVNAKQFGAKGDNTTDDYSSVQAVIDYCIANKRVSHFPGATYKIGTQIRIDGPVTITGDGRGEDGALANPSLGTTLFNCTAIAGLFFIKSQIANNYLYGVAMRGFSIDGGNVAGIGINLSSIVGCKLDQILVLRCTTDGIVVSDNNGVISLQNSITNYTYNAGANAACENSNGLRLADLAGVGGSVQLTGDNISTNTKHGDGLVMDGGDNNTVDRLYGFRQAGGTGSVLKFANGSGAPARNNLIKFLAGGAVKAENATYGNRIMHCTSEANSISIDAGGQLHYTAHDYVNSDLHHSHSYRLSDKEWLSASQLKPDGVVGISALNAGTWDCIAFGDSASGHCYGNIPLPYDWNDGSITGVEVTFATDSANTSDDVVVQLKLSSLATSDATATPNKDQTFTVPVNDTANRINKAILTFTTVLDFVRDDIIMLRLSRLGADGLDTAVGNFQLLGISIIYESDGPNSGGSGPYDISPPSV